MKLKSKSAVIITLISLAVIITLLYFIFRPSSNGQFVVEGDTLMTVVINQNISQQKSLRIDNLKSYDREFEIYSVGLEGLLKAVPSSFSLPSKESQIVDVSFSKPEELEKGVYAGTLFISSKESSQKLMIVARVESEEVSFRIGNIEIYPVGNFVAGDVLNAQLSVFDIDRIGVSTVELEYFIKDFDGNTIFSDSETLTVSDKLALTKTVPLPKTVKNGNYVFAVTLKYLDSVGTASSFFSVGPKEESIFDSNLLYLIAFIAFALLIFLIFVFYSIYSKDRILDELKKQYERELRTQEKYLSNKEKKNEHVLKHKEEKKLNKKIFNKIRKERVLAIKKVHIERIKKIKVLRKQNKKQEALIQIKKWKKQGYDTSVLEARIPNANYVRKKIAEWKRKGYDTSVLEK